jgi:serine/threonine protein kinase
MLKLGNNLKVIYEEISIWEKVSHVNVIKIFELYDDINIPELYLLMEYANYGQIQDYSDTYQ